jgi:hypothetical protein
MRKDTIEIEHDNGKFDPLFAVSVNGVRIGCVRETKDGWIVRGTFSAYVYGQVGETYFPTRDEAVESVLFGYYRQWVKGQGLTVAWPVPELSKVPRRSKASKALKVA